MPQPRHHPPPPDPHALLIALGPRVWSLCRRLCPDPEDAYQAIWEKVLRALPGFDPCGPPARAWVITIAHRHLVDAHRRRQVRGEILPAVDLPSSGPPTDARLLARQREARLEAALARLPEAQRRVVVLHHLEGLSLQDIAAGEGIAEGTVKSRLHRGRAQLALWLGDP